MVEAGAGRDSPRGGGTEISAKEKFKRDHERTTKKGSSRVLYKEDRERPQNEKIGFRPRTTNDRRGGGGGSQEREKKKGGKLRFGT